MKLYILLPLLAGCATTPHIDPSPLFSNDRYERSRKAEEAREAQVEAARIEQGGHGPIPTQAGLDLAVEAVRSSLKNPGSFQLIELDGLFETWDWARTGETRPVFGWGTYVHYRGTNSYGGMISAKTLVILKHDQVVLIGAEKER